ncbi:MAG TPA: hypothetical protein VM053_04100 [Gemmatimonadaceae bacterium]|nr:hypothetical protein [Gemmatimonadaceae bacterium]
MELISTRLKVAGLVLLTVIVAACTENLDNSAGCPLLCVDQQAGVETVTLDVVTFDSTVSALTGQGTELGLLLATRGDSIDSRAIIRFDSIPARFTKPGSDTTSIAVTTVDSALLRFRVDTVGGKIPAQVTLDIYDVNSDAADSLIAPVAALFVPSRLIGSQTYAKADLKDSVTFALPSSAILSHKGGPMRLGIRARASQSVQLKIRSTEYGGTPTTLTYRVSPDTTIAKVVLTPYSKTPATQPALALALADYTLLVKGTATGPSTGLNIGGLPARRVYIRFKIPVFITDSVDIVRASLLLTQIPNNQIDPNDTVYVVPHVVLATDAVTDIAKASQITAEANLDTLRAHPGASGVRSIEIAQIVSLWRSTVNTNTPRAIVLISAQEGESPLEARFFSLEGTPAQRPKLRITYSTRKSKGLP